MIVRKLSIVFLAITLLLGLAYMYRWEKGPTQSTGVRSFVFMKDRWTGQRWLISYNFHSSGPYAGREFPVDDTGNKLNENDAWSERNSATNIWNVFIISSTIATLFFYLLPNKQNKTITI